MMIMMINVERESTSGTWYKTNIKALGVLDNLRDSRLDLLFQAK
jgi:hypothetical protein